MTAVPAHSWMHNPDTFHTAVCYRIENLPYTLPTKFDSVKFIEKLGRDPRTADLSSQDICAAFDRVMSKHKFSHGVADNGADNVRSLAAARETKARDLNKITVEEIVEAHQAAPAKPRPVVETSTVEHRAPRNLVDQTTKTATRFSNEQKIYGAMSLMVAGMSAFGAFNALSHARSEGPDGQKHTNWSNIGIGLFSAAIAAGSAFAAHQTFQAGRA